MGAFDHLFGPGRGKFEKKIFQKFKCPGGCPGGGLLKLRFDWYIISESAPPTPGCTFSHLYHHLHRNQYHQHQGALSVIYTTTCIGISTANIRVHFQSSIPPLASESVPPKSWCTFTSSTKTRVYCHNL